jgi:hypothetical protein
MSNTLVYNVAPPTLPFEPVLINLNRQPDVNGKTLPRGTIPTEARYVKNVLSTSVDTISFLITNIASLEQQQNDTRFTANTGGPGGCPVFVNGTFQSTITDLLPAPPITPDLSEPSVVTTTSDRIRWDVVLRVDNVGVAVPPIGKITIEYEQYKDPLPTSIPTDPRVTESYATLGALQYTVTSFPFAVSLGATVDDFGHVAPRGSWPSEVHWNGNFNDAITGHAIGSLTTSLRSILLVTDRNVIVTKVSNQLNQGRPLTEITNTFFFEDETFNNAIKTSSSAWSGTLAGIEHFLRVEQVGPLIGTKLLVQLAQVPDVYREYVSFVPTIGG